ncbi:MAG: hypothetical protein ABGY72_24715 [bacterium]
MPRHVRGIWLSGAVLLITTAGTVAEARQAPTLPEIMRQKLEHSRQLIEGLVLERFETIERNANDLRILSDLSSWNVLRTPEYQRYSAGFRDTANRLSQAGLDRNLDAATLAYVELTLQCVECHKHVRGVRQAQGLADRPWPELAQIDPDRVKSRGAAP